MRMRSAQMGAAAMACVLGLVARSGADVLELKNGSVLAGKYAGGTTGTIRFETGGSVRALAVSEVLALTLTGAPAPVAVPEPAPAVTAPAPAQAAPAVELAPGTVVVAAGTAMMVRMVDGVSSKSPQGKRFATVLETDLVVGNVMVAKAGTKVYGRVEKAGQAGRLAGKSVLDLRLCELTVGGKLVPIVTGPCALAGARSIGKTAKGALAGAAIGSFSGDSGKGAAIGALASGLKPGQPIVVPPGTLLEFDIQQAVTVNLIR